MQINPAGMAAPELYKLMTGIVVPRPIAWVTSLGPNDVVNLAPFSCFTFVSAKPPMVGITVGLRNGSRKDTVRNIEDVGDFVVNIGDESMIEDIHKSAREYPRDVSEVDILGYSTSASQEIRTPFLAAAPVSLECRFRQAIPCGDDGSQFVIGEVVIFHIRDGLCESNKVDTRRLKPVCRIAGPQYATLGEIVSMQHLGEITTGPV